MEMEKWNKVLKIIISWEKNIQERIKRVIKVRGIIILLNVEINAKLRPLKIFICMKFPALMARMDRMIMFL
jgi:hypothetical protein